MEYSQYMYESRYARLLDWACITDQYYGGTREGVTEGNTGPVMAIG